MTWLVAGATACAVFLVFRPPAVLHLDALTARGERGPARADPPALTRRLRPLLCLVAGTGGWALGGGIAGVALGAVAAAVAWTVLGRVEDPALVRRREQLGADLPLAVDLIASCLDSGAAPPSALVTVGAAIGGPVGEELATVHHRLAVGVDPAEVWDALARHPQLGPLGRSVGRAHETGASVAAAVHRLADELSDRARTEVEEQARSIEVRAAAPLGLCLLPAFMVLGVAPMVVSVFAAMQPFG